MRSLSSRLPPLNSLTAFEAAARHLSITRAASELRVSREAVSRHIRILEDRLGVPLFRRLHRALELTDAGDRLYRTAAAALERLADVAEELARRDRPGPLTVSATVTLSSFWLTPRLGRFRHRHPGLGLHVQVSDTPHDQPGPSFDAGLWYGDGKWPGVEAVRLFEVDSFPVCAPDYFDAHPPMQRPADLLNHTLLNLDGAAHAREDWNWWLARAGVHAAGPRNVLGFDNYVNVIQAARDGQGLALGFSHIIAGLLEAGDLVKPLGDGFPTGYAVYLVSPRRVDARPSARAFAAWVLEEAGAP